MKRTVERLGLYLRFFLEGPPAELESAEPQDQYFIRYVNDVRNHAENELRAEGIDAKSLFEVVKTATGSKALRISLLDEDPLSVGAKQAVEILRAMWEIEVSKDLDDVVTRDALYRGMHLSRCYEQFLANKRFLKTVEARQTSDRNLHKPTVSDAQILAAVEKYRTKDEAANKLGINVRQLYRRLKKIS